MLKKSVILLILLLIPIVHASDILNSQQLELSSKISSTARFHGSGSASSAKVWLNFYPQEDDFQRVTSITTNPSSSEDKEALLFMWTSPPGLILYSADSKLIINHRLTKITKKVKFPTQDLPDAIIKYTQPSENIDSSTIPIVNLANQLAAGEDDLAVVVFKIASWVKDNINYSLNTLTAKVSQKASWVLENRYGVCDEITTLSIALLRSIGIPAKFISGLAYTNWGGINDFGSHGWMEVYFPGFGWVSYDVTYDEFMFADSSHIKLHESIDSKSNSASFEWRGADIGLITNPLSFETKVIKSYPLVSPFEVSARAVRETVGFGSYNLIEASVKNTKQHYTASKIQIGKTSRINAASDNSLHFILKPGQEKKFYFIIQIEEGLDSDYAYTIPVAVYTSDNVTSGTKFTSSETSPIYSYSEINKMLKQRAEEEEKVYSGNIGLSCFSVNSTYLKEGLNIYCTVKNMGNTVINNLDVCIDECKRIDLGISQAANLSFVVVPEKTGKRDFVITAENPDISANFLMVVDVFDIPELEIKSVLFPEGLRFSQEFRLKVIIQQSSYSAPSSIVLSIYQGKKKQSWLISDFSREHEFVVEMNTASFSSKDGKFTAVLEYTDKGGKTYTKEESFIIPLSDITFWHSIILFLNKIF